MVAVCMGLAFGIGWRQTWAHLITIYLLIAVILFSLLRWVLPANLEMLGVADLDPAIQQFVLPLTSGMGETIRVAIVGGAVLALFYAIFMAGADFDRVARRQVAGLTKGPTSAADFNAAAQRLAKQGLWATAILHWQNAAAKAPRHVAYQESLGRAYATLRFYERSLGTLQAAKQRVGSPERQAKIQQQIQAVQAKMKAENSTKQS